MLAWSRIGVDIRLARMLIWGQPIASRKGPAAIMPQAQEGNDREATFRLGALAIITMVVAQVSTYAFTPALPQLVEYFRSPPQQVQLTISAYLLGYALTQLFCGPLSEIAGRRKVLLGALGVFVAGNLACAAASSLGLLLGALFITALGAGGLPSMSQSILRDVYGAQGVSKAASYLVTATAMTPIISPLLGGHVAHWLGWRMIFLANSGLGAAMLLAAFFLLRETGAPTGQRFSGKDVGKAYLELFSNRDFMGYVLLLGFSMGGFIMLFSGAPFIFQLNLKMTPNQYGQWFLVSCLGYPAGSICFRLLIAKMTLRRWGLAGVGLTALGTGIGALLTYHVGPSLWVMVPCILVFSLGLGICVAVGRGGALSALKVNIGIGSGLMGFLFVMVGSAINALGTRFGLVHHQRVALAMLVCSCLSFLALCLVGKRGDR